MYNRLAKLNLPPTCSLLREDEKYEKPKRAATTAIDDMVMITLLSDGLCKNRRIAEAMLLFQEIENRRLDRDIVIYGILIDGLCNAKKLTTAKELFYSLSTKGLELDVQTYTIMIKELCKEGLINEASELLEKMDENGCPPSDHTYNTIIRGYLQHNEDSKAMKYLQIMVDKGFSADVTTATMLVDLPASYLANRSIQELLQKLV